MENVKEFEHISIFRGDLKNYTKEIKELKKQFVKLKITKIEELGIKNLAYEVKGNKQGYYIIFEFEALEKDITKIEKYCHENDNIIKFITIRKY